MSAAISKKTTPPTAVEEVLARLRGRIRRYVVWEGLSMVVIALVASFWIALAIDYLPVLVGANEMPREARACVLAITTVVALFVLYYFLGRRVFRRLEPRSLALLIERRFPDFQDSLVTTVELSGPSRESVDEEFAALQQELSGGLRGRMLEETVSHATDQARQVNLDVIFRKGPLASKLCGAVLAVASVVTLAVLSQDALALAWGRLVWLQDTPWPRQAYIELVGFEDGVRKIAKGTDIAIRVRAAANRKVPPPTLCTILYRSATGDRGRVNMSRDGEVRGGYQYYLFSGKPFKGVLHDITFDVIGFDYRLRDQSLRVVASPVVTEILLQSELPAYTGLLSKEESWSPGMQLPIGSQVQARVRTNKAIVRATLRDVDSGEEVVIAPTAGESNRELAHQLEQLSGRTALAIELLDTDGIRSAEPFLFTLGAIEDVPPVVNVGLRGIGNSITSQARLPVEGTITDDYEVASRYFELQLADGARQFDLGNTPLEPLQSALDLRAEAAASQAQPLVLKPEDRIVFSVKATDHFDLGGEQHIGSSDKVTLTVVRPDELLAILDGRELGLRRRFELIRTETMQSRDSLARLRASFRAEGPEAAPAPSGEPEADDEVAKAAAAAARNVAALRERWASWAHQKSTQTTLEVAGVALAFEDIRDELLNNRVDTPERKVRLEEQIIAPLKEIAEARLPALEAEVQLLEKALQVAPDVAEPASVAALAAADRVVVAMDAVLEKMLELEDYAELVNVIRQILEEQEALLKQTQEQRDADLLDLLK